MRVDKYKLIKEYPGSPKLGSEVIQSGDWDTNWWYRDTNLNINVTLFPEFWEKVVEKDYKILSFINKFNNGIYVQSYNNRDFVICSDLNHYVSLKYAMNQYDIYAVKRLSDGEIFSIGDKVNLSNGNGYKAPILKIELTKNGEKGHLEKYRNRETIKITIETITNEEWGPYELDRIKHSKKPLFTTEDGIDIFEGNTFFWIDKRSYKLGNYTQIYSNISNTLYFSNEEAAKEYILLNKPCLSIKDIFKGKTSFSTPFMEDLKKIVKSKL